MSEIVVVGLGPGSPKYLTRVAQQHLQSGLPLYFRTMKHPSARCFASGYVRPVSFDSRYDAGSNFEQVYRSITKTLLKAVSYHGTIIYAVPGHPHVGEATVERLVRICPRLGIRLKIIDGLSFLEPLLSVLKLDLLEGVTVIDALAVDRLKEPCKKHLIVAQVYSRSLASRVKLKLLDLYPPDHPVTVVQAAGMAQERSWKGPLYALDRRDRFNHFSTICLTPSLAGSIGDLVEIMARLRAADGCPWDREQTHHSLRQYLIEEAYEVVAAIDSGRDDSICEELGDLLLQVVFHSQIAREEERFDLARVIETIVAKLIRRHPHVFGEETAADASGVKVIWEAIKEDERKEENTHAAISVDHALPALLKAFKLQKRAAADGFDWPAIDGPLAKAREELLELEEACRNEDRAGIEEELGDYLFTIVNLARFLKVNPELALGKTIAKFVERYQYVLTKTELSGRPLSSFSLEELDKWWEEAKKIRKMSK